MLAKLVNKENCIYWDHVLPKVEFAFNNTLNKSIGSTPYKLLFGVNQRNTHSDKIVEYFENSHDDTGELRKRAVENNSKSQTMNKTYFDKKRKKVKVYKVNDLVMVVNVDSILGVNKKFNPRFRGPYKIMKVLGNDRYVVRDVEGFQITNKPFEGVYDVSRIKPYIDLKSCYNNYHLPNKSQIK